MVRTLAVSGCRSGTGPLTWGQAAILRIMAMLEERSHDANIAIWALLPGGLTEADGLDWIRRLIAGYDVLRTRYVPDGDDLVQTVDAAGEVEVEVVELGADDPEVTTAEVLSRLRATRFSTADAWAHRFALISRDGAPVRIVFACSHSISDGWGVARSFRAALGRPEEPLDPGVQPLDQMAYEVSDRGRAQNVRARAHWAAHVAAVPAVTFDRVREPHEGTRFWYAEFVSPVVGELLPVLARRHGCTESVVLHAAFCAAIAKTAGMDACPMGIVSGNRARSGTRQAIGPYSQLVPITLSVAGRSHAELVQAAATATLVALRNGAYDPKVRDEVMAEETARRGTPPDVTMWLNYFQFDTVAPADHVPPESLARGVAKWVDRTDRGDSTVYVQAYGGDWTGGLRITVMFDTTRITADEATGILAEVETWLLETR